MSKILLTGPLNEYAHQSLEKFGELVYASDTSEESLLREIDGAMQRILKSMADDMTAYLRGEMPRLVVNPEVLAARTHSID